MAAYWCRRPCEEWLRVRAHGRDGHGPANAHARVHRWGESVCTANAAV